MPNISSTAGNRTPSTRPRRFKPPPQAGASTIVMCDTNGGTHARRDCGDHDARRPAAVDVPLGIHSHNDCDAGGRQLPGRNRCGSSAGAGNDQWLGRTVRQCRSDLVGGQSRTQETGLRSARRSHGVEASHRACRGTSTKLPTCTSGSTSRLSAPVPSPTREGCMCMPWQRRLHSYEHIDPAQVGNERRVLVSELSGRSNIVALATKMNLQRRQSPDGSGSAAGGGTGKPRLSIRGRRGVVRFVGSQSSRDASRRISSWCNITSSVVSRGGEPVTEATIKLRSSTTKSGMRSPRETARSTPSMQPCARRSTVPSRA